MKKSIVLESQSVGMLYPAKHPAAPSLEQHVQVEPNRNWCLPIESSRRQGWLMNH